MVGVRIACVSVATCTRVCAGVDVVCGCGGGGMPIRVCVHVSARVCRRVCV